MNIAGVLFMMCVCCIARMLSNARKLMIGYYLHLFGLREWVGGGNTNKPQTMMVYDSISYLLYKIIIYLFIVIRM